jgi:rhodanese-related sulfurtransferase
MDPRTAADRLHDVQLIDVREPAEWEAGRIESACHIPLGEINDRVDEIDPTRTIVAVCRSGARSARLVEALRAHGYDAENLDGGMQAWAEAGLPFTTPDGRPGAVA